MTPDVASASESKGIAMTERLLARVAAIAAIGAATAGTTPAALAMASTGQAGIHMPTTREPYTQTTDSSSADAEGSSQKNQDLPESDVQDFPKSILRKPDRVQDPEESQKRIQFDQKTKFRSSKKDAQADDYSRVKDPSEDLPPSSDGSSDRLPSSNDGSDNEDPNIVFLGAGKDHSPDPNAAFGGS
jgi:hypothetical protein